MPIVEIAVDCAAAKKILYYFVGEGFYLTSKKDSRGCYHHLKKTKNKIA